MTINRVNTAFSNDDQNSIRNPWQLARASIEALAQAVDSGHSQALTSYLEIMARLYTYSPRNLSLIFAQRPESTHLEGVRSWNELGRFVRSGEKGIFIFAPAIGVKNNNQSQAQTKDASKKSGKGKKAAEPAKEAAQQPETQLLGFRGVHVFDIAQTGGEELPDTRKPVDVAEKLEKLTAFAQAQGMTIEYVTWITPNKGTSYRGTIRLLPNMQPAEAFPVLLREVAGQMLYAIQRRTFVIRKLHQEETKAAAFVVCEALGIEAKATFADCQLYQGDSRLLAESLEVVHRTAAAILRAIRPEDGMPFESAQGVQ